MQLAKIAAAAALVAALHSSALAQTACFAELSAGYGIASADLSDAWTGPITIAADGLQAGAGLGCDVRMGRVVVGALGRYEIADIASKIGTASFGADGQWSVAVRGGVMLSDGALAYGLVGLAGHDVSLAGAGLSETGLLVGGGLEVTAFDPRLAIFAEFTRVYGEREEIAAGVSARPVSDAVRAGVRWRFFTAGGQRE